MSDQKEIETLGLAAKDATGKMMKWKFNRRAIGDNDVHIKVTYSGICHSDIHTAKGEWGPQVYPQVVGHEILGNVVAVGKSVTKFKVGDVAGVGCFVDSCRKCEDCKKGDDNYCTSGMHGTYGSKQPEAVHPTGRTHGGYSKDIVVDENYVLHVPDHLNVAAAAPLLCAGITCYSPFVHFGLKAGMTLGIVGMGGLGHMGAKIGKAMGCKVIAFSRSPSKKEMCMKYADQFVVSTNEDEMKAAARSCDMIYDCVAFKHDIPPILELLKNSGKLIMVGGIPDALEGVSPFVLLMRRLTIAGSCIGGIRETQEMLDFCGKHNIVADIELIPAECEAVDTAWDRAIKGDVKFRFVIDTANTLKE
jgi:uncharacterized zinc-type alcohol dehydrogenase-like protein